MPLKRDNKTWAYKKHTKEQIPILGEKKLNFDISPTDLLCPKYYLTFQEQDLLSWFLED